MSSIEYSQYKDAVYGNLFVGIVLGAYIVVYVTSVYILLRKPGFTSSRPRMIMFGITTLMFALGIIALVLATTLEFLQISSDGEYGPSYEINSYAWAIIVCLMYILCVSICAWRTVVLWNKDKRVIAILVFCILATTATAGCHCALVFGIIQITPPLGKLSLMVVCPILGTNMLSTGLIAWKAWQRRISVRKHLCEGRGTVRVDRVFALLIESGLIYCLVWSLYWISTSGALPDPGFTSIALISGLYPTLIIILVSMQMSPVDHYSTHSEIQFPRGPALGPPRAGSMPRQVVLIQREHTSDFDTQIPSTAFRKPSYDEKDLCSDPC